MITWVVGLVLCCQTPVPPASAFGSKIDLQGAVLFFPRDYHPRGGKIDVVLHLHGAEGTVQKALVESGWHDTALVIFNRSGLSAVYTKPFSDPRLFFRLLDKVREAARTEKVEANPTIGRVVVSSFSAGFGGVRELLKVPESFQRIDAVVLADSLYCGYAEKPGKLELDPSKMADFRRFAVEAAAGRKIMLVSHSSQIPEGYGSTTETADDLIAHVGGGSVASERDWGDGWKQIRQFTKGQFQVIGFAGTEGVDHLRHLRRLGELWKSMPTPFPNEG